MGSKEMDRANYGQGNKQNGGESILPGRGKLNKYMEYLRKGSNTSDKTKNPRNLFDDLNRLDRKWLKQARKFLSKIEKSN